MKSKVILVLLIIYFLTPFFALAVKKIENVSPLQPIPDDVQPNHQININQSSLSSQSESFLMENSPIIPTPILSTTTTNTYTINSTNNTTSPILTTGDVVLYTNGNNYNIGIVTTPLSSVDFSINGTPLNGTFEILKIASGPTETVSFNTGISGDAPWINVSGDYVAPNLGDIVLLQAENSKPVWGVVTSVPNDNKNAFMVNDQKLALLTNYIMTKINGDNTVTSKIDPNTPGKLLSSINFLEGDWVIGDTGHGYTWGIVTTPENLRASGTVYALRLNGASTAPMFKPGTRISKVTPTSSTSSENSNTSLYFILSTLAVLVVAGILYYVFK